MRGSDYSRLEQWLHWLALEPRAVRELSFDLERRYSARRSAAPSGRAAYVCGLARSGTTVLLRALARSNAFRSLTYRDMPFVLAPNLWRRITRGTSRSSLPVERAHGDGVMVDFDSPEAFEEVFWRTFCPQPAGSNCYAPNDPTADALRAFADYRAVVAGEKRYLSKNNNNLVRLRALTEHGEGTIVVVYRHPIEAARSLYRQHRRFCEAQAEAPFTRSYMAWLGHHEFGLDHKPFCFAVGAMDPQLSPGEPNYWLEYWIAVHQHIERQSLPLRLWDYDRSCVRPHEAMRSLLAELDVDADVAEVSREVRAPRAPALPPDEFGAGQVERALAAYSSLQGHRNNLYT